MNCEQLWREQKQKQAKPNKNVKRLWPTIRD